MEAFPLHRVTDPNPQGRSAETKRELVRTTAAKLRCIANLLEHITRNPKLNDEQITSLANAAILGLKD